MALSCLFLFLFFLIFIFTKYQGQLQIGESKYYYTILFTTTTTIINYICVIRKILKY